MADIKEIIKNFISFDVENDFYKNELKNQVVQDFKKILFEDETRVRKFLVKFFEQASELAEEFDLVSDGKEEFKGEEEPEVKEESEEVESEEEEEMKENFLIKVANDYLI